MIETKEQRKARKLAVRGQMFLTNGTLVNVPPRPSKADRRAARRVPLALGEPVPPLLANWKATSQKQLARVSQYGERRIQEQNEKRNG
jgi:hypothetical protein